MRCISLHPLSRHRYTSTIYEYRTTAFTPSALRIVVERLLGNYYICWTDDIFIFQSRCYGHPPAKSAGNRYHTRIIKTQKYDISLQRSSDICSEATHPFMIGLHQRHPPGTYIEGVLYKYGNKSAVNILL